MPVRFNTANEITAHTKMCSNPSVATVSNGVVKAVKAGEAIIAVKTVDGEKKATCTIKVKSKTNVGVGEWGDGGNNEGVAS